MRDNKHPWTARRIAALTGVVLLVLLYIITLAAAVLDSSAAGSLFRACLFLTIALPILLWVILWCVGRMTGKKTAADLDILQSDKEEREKMEKELKGTQGQP